jgi:hypothetical protein
MAQVLTAIILFLMAKLLLAVVVVQEVLTTLVQVLQVQVVPAVVV